mmetsp:Transcript_17696/g.57877  ORF Transcript_17696/g.57877 Transcript_17696/m.57877 type:complete len:132 (+) Transcript_17696:824-1219(+)
MGPGAVYSDASAPTAPPQKPCLYARNTDAASDAHEEEKSDERATIDDDDSFWHAHRGGSEMSVGGYVIPLKPAAWAADAVPPLPPELRQCGQYSAVTQLSCGGSRQYASSDHDTPAGLLGGHSFGHPPWSP